MLKLLLFVILIIIALPLFLLWNVIFGVRRGLRRTQQQYGYGSRQRQQVQPEPDTQGKVLNRIEEDAEFEEVDGPRQPIETPTSVPQEDQITDAEFEEVI